jgi:hypothetical protein
MVCALASAMECTEVAFGVDATATRQVPPDIKCLKNGILGNFLPLRVEEFSDTFWDLLGAYGSQQLQWALAIRGVKPSASPHCAFAKGFGH